MRAKALFRIIIWLVISILCASILAFVLLGQWDSFVQRLGFINYDDSGYTVGDGEIKNFDDVKGIEIEWVSGTVSIGIDYDDVISLKETSTRKLDDWQQMRYKVVDGILSVKFTAPKTYEFWKTVRSKKLQLGLPEALLKNVGSVKILSAAANIETSKLHAQKIDINSGGGKVVLMNSIAEDLKINSVSGNVYIDLPTCDGIKVNFKTVSGKFTDKINMEKAGDTYVYKDGTCRFSIETDTGNLEISE